MKKNIPAQHEKKSPEELLLQVISASATNPKLALVAGDAAESLSGDNIAINQALGVEVRNQSAIMKLQALFNEAAQHLAKSPNAAASFVDAIKKNETDTAIGLLIHGKPEGVGWLKRLIPFVDKSDVNKLPKVSVELVRSLLEVQGDVAEWITASIVPQLPKNAETTDGDTPLAQAACSKPLVMQQLVKHNPNFILEKNKDGLQLPAFLYNEKNSQAALALAIQQPQTALGLSAQLFLNNDAANLEKLFSGLENEDKLNLINNLPTTKVKKDLPLAHAIIENDPSKITTLLKYCPNALTLANDGRKSAFSLLAVRDKKTFVALAQKYPEAVLIKDSPEGRYPLSHFGKDEMELLQLLEKQLKTLPVTKATLEALQDYERTETLAYLYKDQKNAFDKISLKIKFNEKDGGIVLPLAYVIQQKNIKAENGEESILDYLLKKGDFENALKLAENNPKLLLYKTVNKIAEFAPLNTSGDKIVNDFLKIIENNDAAAELFDTRIEKYQSWMQLTDKKIRKIFTDFHSANENILSKSDKFNKAISYIDNIWQSYSLVDRIVKGQEKKDKDIVEKLMNKAVTAFMNVGLVDTQAIVQMNKSMKSYRDANITAEMHLKEYMNMMLTGVELNPLLLKCTTTNGKTVQDVLQRIAESTDRTYSSYRHSEESIKSLGLSPWVNAAKKTLQNAKKAIEEDSKKKKTSSFAQKYLNESPRDNYLE